MSHLPMRRLLPAILVAAGLLSIGTVHDAGAAGGGLVAAYSFDQGSGTSAPDLSGNGNTATLHNATFVAGGKYGGAVSLNGTNASVTVPDSASKTGASLESDSAVVSGRGCSSFSTLTVPFLPATSTDTISSAKRPEFEASAARRCDSAA